MNGDRFQMIAATRTTQPAVGVAFVACPVAVQSWAGGPSQWEQVYRLAYERARAVVRPSIVERLQKNLLN